MHQAPGWPRSSGIYQPNKTPIPVPIGSSDASQPAAETQPSATAAASPAGKLLRSCIEAAADALIASAARLDELDGAVGDGDCGSTLATAAKAIKQVSYAFFGAAWRRYLPASFARRLNDASLSRCTIQGARG